MTTMEAYAPAAERGIAPVTHQEATPLTGRPGPDSFHSTEATPHHQPMVFFEPKKQFEAEPDAEMVDMPLETELPTPAEHMGRTGQTEKTEQIEENEDLIQTEGIERNSESKQPDQAEQQGNPHGENNPPVPDSKAKGQDLGQLSQPTETRAELPGLSGIEHIASPHTSQQPLEKAKETQELSRLNAQLATASPEARQLLEPALKSAAQVSALSHDLPARLELAQELEELPEAAQAQETQRQLSQQTEEVAGTALDTDQDLRQAQEALTQEIQSGKLEAPNANEAAPQPKGAERPAAIREIKEKGTPSPENEPVQELAQEPAQEQAQESPQNQSPETEPVSEPLPERLITRESERPVSLSANLETTFSPEQQFNDHADQLERLSKMAPTQRDEFQHTVESDNGSKRTSKHSFQASRPEDAKRAWDAALGQVKQNMAISGLLAENRTSLESLERTLQLVYPEMRIDFSGLKAWEDGMQLSKEIDDNGVTYLSIKEAPATQEPTQPYQRTHLHAY